MEDTAEECDLNVHQINTIRWKLMKECEQMFWNMGMYQERQKGKKNQRRINTERRTLANEVL